MASSAAPDTALASLQATALTARCHNAFFRQKQLKALHDTLRNSTAAVQDAIKADTRSSDVEAATEVALALQLVKEHYASVHPQKEREEEYRVANGKDARDSARPWDVVFIEPQQSHTPFFSVVSALSAAVVAGSCVALKLENNLRALPSLLRKILPEALEADTFAVVASDPSSNSLATTFQVYQETEVQQPTYLQLASSKRKVVAIVDRTADLVQAAEQLVTARFAFGGTSPYAPDIVLVNEFVKKEFLEQVLQRSIQFLSGSRSLTTTNGDSKTAAQKPASTIATALHLLQESRSWGVTTITQGDNGAVVELTNLAALPPKVGQAVFSLSAVTSLEHAISLVDEDLGHQETLLAGYHFGTLAAGKYLSQFVHADASFTNHVPFRLLLGPAAPAFVAVEIEKRYTKEHFTHASPAFVTVPSSQANVAQAIAGKDAVSAAAELLGQASEEIKEKKRPVWYGPGFFEQGILIGLSVYGIPVLTCVGATLYYGVRTGLRRWVFV